MKTASEKTHRRSKRLRPVTGRAREVLDVMFNAIAFGKFDERCSVDDLAAQFKTTPGRLMPTLTKLKDAGYIAIEGKVLPYVYPTLAAIQAQDRHLEAKDARRLLKQLKR